MMSAPVLSIQKPPVAATAPRPRHILYLFDQLRALNGGAERSLLRLTQTLPADRYRASVATFWQPEDKAFLDYFRCPVHLLPMSSAYNWNSFKVARRLREIIRKENVSIVQTFFSTSDLWGGPVAKLSGCPVLISSRRDMGFLRTPKHRLAYRFMAPLFDHVHTVSDAVRDYTIREDRMAPGRVTTIPNGVELPRPVTAQDRRRLRQEFGLTGAGPVVLSLGTIKRVRGYEVLIRTAAAVCRRHPDTVFAIFGAVADEPYYQELRHQITALGLERNVLFLGYFEDGQRLFPLGDLYCHLSLNDGLSNALLEAMAAGLPSVISRVGGNPEVIAEGRTGYIVPPGDHEAAAGRVLALLSGPEQAQRMGQQARACIAREFTAEAMALKFASLYDRLLFEEKPQ